MILQNIVKAGFTGSIYPVNPKHAEIAGLACFPTIREVPQPVDLAIISTPAATVTDIVRDCGQSRVGGLVAISAGFRETGPTGESREAALRTELARWPEMRMIGPNCLGVIAPHSVLNASFAAGMPAAGKVAFVSQSGALCTAVLDWALQEGIGFSYFVSIGNALDVSVGDLIEFFNADQHTDAIVLYLESLADATSFMSAARAFARNKPIIAYKAGRFAQSALAAKSHTGAIAGVDAVYAAAFRRAGVVRVNDMSDLFDCAELLARQKLPQGPRLAIMTNAGGPGVMATDALLDRQGDLAVLSADTLVNLNRFLPAAWSHGNPVDVLGDATPMRVAQAAKTVLEDPGVDALLVIFSPQAMSEPAEAARQIIQIAAESPKPVLTSWMGGLAMAQAVDLLNCAGIPTYPTPEHAIRAFMYLVSSARGKEILHQTTSELAISYPPQRAETLEWLTRALSQQTATLDEAESKQLLAAYGIPVSEPRSAKTADEAVSLARALTYPVVLKVLSPQISHKTDVHGVRLGLATDQEVRLAFEEIVAMARDKRPDAQVDGVTVQQMVTSKHGCELILGMNRDAVFGPVLLIGAGGVAAELYGDHVLELPPLTKPLALGMLKSLRIWPLLQGYRGQPPLQVDSLIEIILRLSRLVEENPQIKELDINPLLATPERVIALDARIVLDATPLPISDRIRPRL